MLKLKLQYFGHLLQRADSLEKTLMLERLKAREVGDRGWDGWMASLTQWTWVWANAGRLWRTGKPGVLPSVEWDTAEWLSNSNKANPQIILSLPPMWKETERKICSSDPPKAEEFLPLAYAWQCEIPLIFPRVSLPVDTQTTTYMELMLV